MKLQFAEKLTTFPTIGDATAVRVAAHYDSLEDLSTASREELCEIEGIGGVTASRLGMWAERHG